MFAIYYEKCQTYPSGDGVTEGRGPRAGGSNQLPGGGWKPRLAAPEALTQRVRGGAGDSASFTSPRGCRWGTRAPLPATSPTAASLRPLSPPERGRITSSLNVSVCISTKMVLGQKRRIWGPELCLLQSPFRGQWAEGRAAGPARPPSSGGVRGPASAVRSQRAGLGLGSQWRTH